MLIRGQVWTAATGNESSLIWKRSTCRQEVGWLRYHFLPLIVNFTKIQALILWQYSPKNKMFTLVLFYYTNKKNYIFKMMKYIKIYIYIFCNFTLVYSWFAIEKPHLKISSCPSFCRSHLEELGNGWPPLNHCTVGNGKPSTKQCSAASISTGTVRFWGPSIIVMSTLEPVQQI